MWNIGLEPVHAIDWFAVENLALQSPLAGVMEIM